MINPSLYKKIPTVSVETRKTSSLTQNEKNQVNQTISKFFELFMNKHL